MAHFLSQNWLISRRHALRGLGVSLALPLLDCMRPLGAAETKSRAKRSVFIYLPNGVNTIDFQITQPGADYKFSKSLLPLEKHRANITPISGLYHPHGLGHHHNCSSIWLTGGKIGQSERNTISVDQLMAQVTAPQTRYSSIEMSNQGQSLAYTADGIGLPAQGNPGVVFREMFTAPQGGIVKQRRGLQRRGSILDAVLGEATTLGDQLGQEDRGRLEQYLTSVREVEVRTQRADKWLDTPRPTVDAAVQSQLNRDIALDRLGEYLRTMYDIIVLAFQTDMTRVATFSTGEEGKGPAVPEIGVKQDRHSLSHHNANPKLMQDLTASDTFNIQQFSYFLDRLSQVKDADGPLLDSTMALYGSGMAFGHSHGNANLPLILAGGGGLGLKHGRHVDFNAKSKPEGYAYNLDIHAKHYAICHNPVNNKAHLSNLLLTMAQKMDVKTEKFADSTGTVSEVLA
ncbi:hypothetical protein ETAA8_33120 [Anatilimnocola aggregata]|uniref:DUF1552 domain-containing protein n=1 Tax=Anatilimnocola aggregata TaxID=2528021 RepID=A0A517YDK2_9BACT|nr:DUF1552 domain-containing protein [Anatilimnocola aggregata]QDU28212.1 hypothetical protein ETAA8_33120 [Anatilimnocola aggregata]